MFLDQRINFFTPPQFAASGTAAVSALLGTTQKWAIDRTWPIEEIIIHCYFVVGTSMTPTVLTTGQTPDQVDNITTLLQRVNLSVNDGKQPRSVVDCSGIGLIESTYHLGFNNDQPTNGLLALSQPIPTVTAAQTELQGGSVNNVGEALTNPTIPVATYALTYRVPMVEPWVGEPLRSRMYLPVHLYPQDPVLSLTFQTGGNLMGGAAYATNITSIFVEIELIRRVPTAASEAILRKFPGSNPNGYIDWDFIESPFAVAPGVSTEQRFALPIPGQYANLIFRQYLGGAIVTKNVLDNGGIGNTTANGFGNEDRWRLETGLVVLRDWRWKHLRALNDFGRSLTSINCAAVPSAGTVNNNINYGVPGATMLIPGSPPTLAGVNFRAANSTKLDFLGDGLTADSGVELGSLLDCNTPANNGLKMEIIGKPANVATNSSFMFIVGRRYFGDLSRWQKFA